MSRLPQFTSSVASLVVLGGLAGLGLSGCGSGGGGSGSGSGSTDSPPSFTPAQAEYPYGDPLCMALSPDHKLAFVGEGAALALVDIGSSSPASAICLKTRIPLGVSCLSLLPVADRVFLCSGKLGLFDLATCPGLSDSCAAACATYPLTPIERVENKLCISAVAVHGHAAGDLVLALYSAKNDSELRVYDLAPPHALRAVTAVQGGDPSQAFALAADALDPNRVYAALGSGGVVRLDIGNLDHILVEQGPIFDQPDQRLYGQPAKALDLAIAGGLLYAAIDKGGVVEIDLAEPWSADASYVYRTLDCGPNTAAYAYRVAALTDEAGRTLVAVGTHTSSAQEFDGGPFSLFGVWDYALGLGNVPEPQPGDPIGCDSSLYFFQHVPSGSGESGTGGCAAGDLCPIPGLTTATAPWRSLALRRQGANFQVCEGRRNGFGLVDLGPNPFSGDAFVYEPIASLSTPGLAPAGGVASAIDPGLLYLSNDPAGSVFAGMARIGAGDDSVELVPNTRGLCMLPTNPAEYCDAALPATDVPLPFTNGLFSTAHWIDPTDPTREWFVGGETSVYRQCTAPCSYSDQWCQSVWQAPEHTEKPEPGWKVLSFRPGVQDGAEWDLRWWQIASPPDLNLNTGRNYLGSASDPRPESSLIHLTRSGTAAGYLVCDRNEIMSDAASLCPETNGRGQELGLHFLHVLSTHLEFAGVGGGCVSTEALALTTGAEVFAVDVGGTTRWVAAIAAGFPSNPCAALEWQPYYQRAMVVFYDVTTVDADHAPVLLRLAFGPEGTLGNALTLTVKEVGGRTYAFVADVGGRLLMYDVSGDVLYPAPSGPSHPSTGLLPTSVWTSPPNPFDGFRDNILDVAVVPPHAYLATGRRGVTVLDVGTDPHAPHELEASPLLTPGLALSLILRTSGSSSTLVVSDSRAGLRVYALPIF